MTLTVAQVLGWRPDALAAAAHGVSTAHTTVDAQFTTLARGVDAMNWHGTAGDAATKRLGLEHQYARGVSAALADLEHTLTAQATALAAAKSAVERARDAALAQKFEVHDDGTVTADARWAQLSAAKAKVGDLTWIRLQIDVLNAQKALQAALAEAEKAAGVAAAQLRTVLSDAGLTAAAPPPVGGPPASTSAAGAKPPPAPVPTPPRVGDVVGWHPPQSSHGFASGGGSGYGDDGGYGGSTGGGYRSGGHHNGYSIAGHEHTGSLGSSGGPPLERPTGAKAEWIQQALEVLREMGYDTSTISPADIEAIIDHESGGDPHAINLWDSNAAAGHPSKGLMQCIDSTFNAYKAPGHGDIWNPVDNIVAGVRYAMARYGSVANVPGVVALHQGGAYVGY